MSAGSSETRKRFAEILEAARTQDRSSQSATMVVLSHIQQMTLLMIKKGLTFYCDQDTYRSRTRFLDDVITLNKLDIRFPAIIRNFLIDGCGLFYFRPDPKLKYQIYFFNKDQYRVYHDVNGSVEEVIIIYSYKVKNSGLGLPSNTYGQNKRYVRLSITADEISEVETDTELSFDLEPGAVLTPSKTRPNNLGFIPAVEVLNKPNASGTDGEGEFDPFMEQIVLHDQLSRNIAKNIEFFGNPTLISSRPRSDLVEANDSQSTFRPTISSQSGFAGVDSPSTRVSEPFGPSMGGGLRVPRIIANVEASDRVSQMLQTPHPLAPDQPLGADPRLNITPLLYRTFDHLAQELTYSGSYEPADPSFDPEPGSGSSPLGGASNGPGLNRLPAVGGANQYPGGSFGTYSPNAVAGNTGFGPFYQQPVQPVSVRLLPEQSVGSSNGQPGAGGVQDVTTPQPNSTVSTVRDDATGYSSVQSAFTGPTMGVPSAYGSPDLLQQRLYDPGFLSGFYGHAA
jgi:hypothetical protein